jgi:hypothetical protein
MGQKSSLPAASLIDGRRRYGNSKSLGNAKNDREKVRNENNLSVVAFFNELFGSVSIRQLALC